MYVSRFLYCFSAVNFETWHLELIAGLVIIISSSRYILLQTWPDFRYSSETANRQVYTTLQSVFPFCFIFLLMKVCHWQIQFLK
ncbi:Os05g0295200 [Oryza sativa Japonica Group]|jgi:hypothetical protein|uniref:Os05g0295200 protein n=1 Tax=Oryza sativa subsp. japonica TaxID=39947 RepID=C7J2E6_ORYSJ|nr:Os05g0295200 [Oryza sativa Japonica Group]|eukprot:NP_001174327.1 Os05g0295200 [Oryza sativa Japonica Group]